MYDTFENVVFFLWNVFHLFIVKGTMQNSVPQYVLQPSSPLLLLYNDLRDSYIFFLFLILASGVVCVA